MLQSSPPKGEELGFLPLCVTVCRLAPRHRVLKSPGSGSLGPQSQASSMCLATECIGNVDEQLLHAQKEMETGVRGVVLNSAIPANPVSWLFLILPICMSSATVWQGWGLRNKYPIRYHRCSMFHFPLQTHFLLYFLQLLLSLRLVIPCCVIGLLCSLASGWSEALGGASRMLKGRGP